MAGHRPFLTKSLLNSAAADCKSLRHKIEMTVRGAYVFLILIRVRAHLSHQMTLPLSDGERLIEIPLRIQTDAHARPGRGIPKGLYRLMLSTSRRREGTDRFFISETT